uniref:undecaprenyldiphospho-muramoylpentapeptide beta-N-acetylglucosaminyltransferase n=1 Tax=Marinobacterium profundum TaxID=1714300 RepID=UPI0008298F40|nr:undecaprenyldiphospho-muramoylpentapeptide beta-N-acetylglucosaminyltransferase [Marinobacterium profundum]
MTAWQGKKVLVMAGGTGGHVFPALATARELQREGVQVEWLGTRRGIESDLVPAAGIELHYIDVAGLRGKGRLSLALAPLRLARALWQAWCLLRRYQPDLVLGMGGFAAGPGGLAARLQGRPLVIHEQNATAGMTNRILSRMATRVLEAFGGAFGAGRDVTLTGNPVRGAILELAPPEERMQGRTGPLRLLVVGGSLGARAINDLLPKVLASLAPEQRPLVRHQTGRKLLDETQALYRDCGVEAEVVPFIDRMDEAYGWADLVLCRAGALTVSELSIAGVAAVLVPFPFAVDDHQTGNAAYLAGPGAARLIQQRDLDESALKALLEELGSRETLLGMAKIARAQGRPEASRDVARICLETMK